MQRKSGVLIQGQIHLTESPKGITDNRLASGLKPSESCNCKIKGLQVEQVGQLSKQLDQIYITAGVWAWRERESPIPLMKHLELQELSIVSGGSVEQKILSTQFFAPSFPHKKT